MNTKGFIIITQEDSVVWEDQDTRTPFATREDAEDQAEELAREGDGYMPHVVSVDEHFARYQTLLAGLRDSRLAIAEDDDITPLDIWHSLVGRIADYLAAHDAALDPVDFCKSANA